MILLPGNTDGILGLEVIVAGPVPLPETKPSSTNGQITWNGAPVRARRFLARD
jgi:hypothetical protein